MKISTPQTTPPVSDLEHLARARKFTARRDGLRSHGRQSYTFANTLTKDQTN